MEVAAGAAASGAVAQTKKELEGCDWVKWASNLVALAVGEWLLL